MASLVLGRFAVLGETQHHPNGTVGGEERVCPGLCVFVRVCFCKKDEGQILKLSTAKIESFTIFTVHLWTESQSGTQLHLSRIMYIMMWKTRSDKVK